MNCFALRLVVCSVMAVVVAAPALAEVGTVAAARGTAEIGRNGTWTPATAGNPIEQGDRLRTGAPGQLRVVFQDDSVLTLNDDTELVVDESVFAPEQGKARSLTELLHGAVNAVVSEYYEQPGSEYTIKTATATAGVRGTEFIVSYYPEAEVAEVIGISGTVAVRSTLSDIDETVYVTSEQISQVAKGLQPSPAQPFSGESLQERLQRFDLVGTSPIEDLAAWQGAGAAASGVGRQRLNTFAARQERTRRAQDAANLLSDSPALVGRSQLGVSF